MDSRKSNDVLHVEKAKELEGPNGNASQYNFDTNEEQAPAHLHIKTYLVVAAVSFLQFALLIQLVAVGAFQSTVAQAIGGTDISGWMFTSLTITFVVFAPPVSQAADYWGRRWLLIILTLAGTVGTIITSTANSMGVAIVGEAFVGASFASTPLSFAVASEVLPHRYRLAGQASINAFGGLGTILSLLVGGRLVETNGPQGFRVLWYINVGVDLVEDKLSLTSLWAGVYALAAVGCFFFYRPPLREMQQSLSLREKLQRLDWMGYFITLCASVLLVIGLSWAQNPYSWRDAHVLAPLIIGGLLFVLLGVYAWKINPASFMPHTLFSRDRNLALAMTSVLLEGTIFGACNVYLPFQTATLYKSSPLSVSLVYCITMFGYIIWSPVAAVVSYRFKQVRSLIIVGFLSFLVFAICMATTTLDSRVAVWGYQAFLGFGLSLVLNGVVTAGQLSAPAEHIAIASGLIAAIRSLGVTVSVAIYGAIFHARISALLPPKIGAAALSNGLPKSSLPALISGLTNQAPTLAGIPGITPWIIETSAEALKRAYLESFQSVWIAVCCFAGVGVVASLAFLNPAKDLNNQIDAPAESEKDLYG